MPSLLNILECDLDLDPLEVQEALNQLTPLEEFLAQPNRDLSTPFTGINGTKSWYDIKGKRHRGRGLPAVIVDSGYQAFYRHGDLHRVDGPAIVYSDGSYQWYFKGLLHRVGGPASHYPSGAEAWYLHGVLHREDGPAVTEDSGYQEWTIHGEPHRLDGPAIITEEGDEQYFLHGINYDYEEWLEERIKHLPKPTSRFERPNLL